MTSHSLTPATEARLLELDADAAHLSQLDGPGAKHYLDAISQAMDCGPYSESEVTALSDVEGMLAELDVERAALKLGLFVRSTGGPLLHVLGADETGRVYRADWPHGGNACQDEGSG